MNDAPDPHAGGTLFTPVRVEARRLELRADYYSSPIDLGVLKARYPPFQVLSADPLVLSLSKSAHVVVLRFGAVVFWQCEDSECADILEEIQLVTKLDPPAREVRDALVVLVDQAEDRVNFRDVWLKDLTLEHIRIISQTLGRSVALKQCELSVTQALTKTTPIVQALRDRGALTSSERHILKTVGFTLAVKETILAKLGLSDDPAETWDSERLSRLHALLSDHLDIKKRLSALHEKMEFLSDLNLMLLTLLQNRTSHRLEWIVILLIVIEVAFSFVHFFSTFH